VSDSKYTDFIPRWMREKTEKDDILDHSPATGSLAEVSPRINARLLPVSGSNRLSAKTLSEAISLTQSIVQYAGYDVYHGFNPDFTDLRSLSAELVLFTRLTVEPFEEGSFVIPARLEANPLTVEGAEQPRMITAEDVVKRFDEIFASLQDQSSVHQVSIGAIQAVESLGKVIRREAEAIEFESFDSLGKPRPTFRVDESYISRVQKVRESRRPTRARLETLEGKVTALDILESKLQLSLEGQRRRVIGHFSIMFLPFLLESLGRRVRLYGKVEWQKNHPYSIQIVTAEVLSDEG
jgi:hypothetical protein